MRLDEATHARLTARFGAAVDPWWERLPGVLAELAERWELNLGDPVGRGATSLVLRCRRADGSAAILKLTPDAALGRAEAAAVRQWALSGRVPALWEHDPETGALRDLHPGNVLDGGPARGLVAIDPRPCVGDGAFDAVDWVVWAVEPSGWRTRCDALATALGVDAKRLWAWCEAFAALLAGSAAQGADPARAAALLALSRGSAG